LLNSMSNNVFVYSGNRSVLSSAYLKSLCPDNGLKSLLIIRYKVRPTPETCTILRPMSTAADETPLIADFYSIEMNRSDLTTKSVKLSCTRLDYSMKWSAESSQSLSTLTDGYFLSYHVTFCRTSLLTKVTTSALVCFTHQLT